MKKESKNISNHNHARLICYCGMSLWSSPPPLTKTKPYTDSWGDRKLFIDLTKFKGPADFKNRKTITELT